MIRDPVRVVRAYVRDLEPLHQELRELEDPWGEGLHPLGEPSVSRQLCRHGVEFADHPDARARGGHDGLVGREGIHEAPYQGYRLALIAGVEVHLAAAGLLERELDLMAQPLEESHGRPARLGKERVVEARDKERYAHGRPRASGHHVLPMRPSIRTSYPGRSALHDSLFKELAIRLWFPGWLAADLASG